MMSVAQKYFSHRFFDALFLGIISYCSSRIAFYFLIQPEGMAPFWFANGLVLAVLLRRPQKDWPILLIASFAGFCINASQLGFPIFPDYVYGFGNVLEPLLAALIIQKLSPRFTLRSLIDLRTLFFVSFVACVAGATIAWSVGPIRWTLWLIDDWLGMLLITPALIAFWPVSSRFLKLSIPTKKHFLEMLVILGGMILISTTLVMHLNGSSAFFYTYSLLPFLLWATLRFQVKGAIIACVFLGLLTLGFTIYGIGPIGAISAMEIDRSLSAQVFLSIVMLSYLSLGIALQEKIHTSDLRNIQIKILERTSHGDSLKNVLEQIVLFAESQEEGMVCSILLLDSKEGRVYHGAAPHLPLEYIKAIDGVQIGPEAGSCGVAAYTGKQVFVEDINSHRFWVDYKHLALKHGLRACWSSPIFSSSNQVVGTFAVYYRELRKPTQYEIEWLDVATFLASIAIRKSRNEQAIIRSETRNRQLIETTHEGVWIINNDFKTTYVNPRMTELLGYTSDELLEKSPFFFVHEEDLQIAHNKLFSRLKGRSDLHEIRLRHKDSSIRWVVIAVSPILSDTGEIEGVLGMVTDLTEKKLLEKQIIFAQKMDSLGALAGGVAHDFNNILAAISANVSLLLTKKDLTTDYINQRLEIIQNACIRATNLVRQILTFSRKSSPKQEVVNIASVVKEAISLLQTSVDPRIQIRSTIEDSLPQIIADTSQIHQIIMNLGINAAQAIEEKAGVINFKLESTVLTTPVAAVGIELSPGQFVRLTVSDTGKGMNDQVITKIFDPFFTTKKTGVGTGLGLSVVYGIMKNHSGAITVKSELGKGTEFQLFFPVANLEILSSQSLPEKK